MGRLARLISSDDYYDQVAILLGSLMPVVVSGSQGGTGQDTSAKTGLVSLNTGTWYFSPQRWVANTLAKDATATTGTDDSAALQAIITALATSAKPSTLIVEGSVRLNSTVTLASNITYDFRNATFYPGATMAGTWMFYGSALTNFEIYGGRYLKATYSPETAGVVHNFIDGVAIHLVGCSQFRIHRGYFSEWFGDINTYDCSNYWVDNNYSFNSNASIVLLSNTAAITGIHCLSNKIIGCEDDGIFLGGMGAGASTVKDAWICFNQIDKTRFDASVAVAIGIRVGNYTGAAALHSGIHIIENTMRDMVTQGLIAFDVADGECVGNLIDGYARRPAVAYLFGLDTGEAFTGDILNNRALNPLSTTAYGMGCQYVTKSRICENKLHANFSGVPTMLIQHSTNNQFISNYLANADGADGRCLEETPAVGNDYNVFELNDVREGTGATKFYALATNSTVRGNPGYRSRNSGVTGAIATGVTVAHGLAGTPQSVLVTCLDAGGIAVSATADGTDITFTFAGGGTHLISWEARLVNDR
jgi:hypothetical protein